MLTVPAPSCSQLYDALRTASAALQVWASRNIKQGEELMFSYGGRSSTDFCAWYGFVPLHNVRDNVVLFSSIEAAADWLPHKSGLRRVAGHDDKLELKRSKQRTGAKTRCSAMVAILPA